MHRRGLLVGLASLLVLVGAVASTMAAVRAPAVLGNNMVLQRGVNVPIWGWGDAGEVVTVTIAGQSVSTKVDDKGQWKAVLSNLKAGGPFDMSIKANSGALTLKNILVGEVWVASGQSNMQMGVDSTRDAPKDIPAANYPKVRLFNVVRQEKHIPATDCQGQWSECNPETVRNFSAVAYYFGRMLHTELNVPVGLINTSWSGTRIEAWSGKNALAGQAIPQGVETSYLYNGMVAPLMPYAIRGAIWYQGEANLGNAYQYRSLFPAMVKDWRAAWGQGDFPFYFVEISPYRYNNPACPELWEAQFLSLKSIPNSGMAVTTDIGDLLDIHPRNKREVGRRLALWALAKTYGQRLAYSGPLYRSMSVEDHAIRLTFDYADGLKPADGKPLSDFTIAGPDQKFEPAEARIDGQSILVSSPAVAQPVAVRFGWHEDAMPNLVNQAGLPASPFRTDSWKGLTQP